MAEQKRMKYRMAFVCPVKDMGKVKKTKHRRGVHGKVQEKTIHSIMVGFIESPGGL